MKLGFALLLALASASEICGGFNNAKCPEGEKCLDSNGKLSPTGTCQKVECPVFKCANPCAACDENIFECKIKNNFFDNGCEGCPTGQCKKKKKSDFVDLCQDPCSAVRCKGTCKNIRNGKGKCKSPKCIAPE